MTTQKGKSAFLPIRRRLRSNQTPAEQLLWSKLRGYQIQGLKFRRQHGIGPYIVDFFCPERALVIEVDGDGITATENTIKNDRLRETHLHSLGIMIVRYNNDEVLGNLDGVLEDITFQISKSSTSPNPSLQRRGRQNDDSTSKFLPVIHHRPRTFLTNEQNQNSFSLSTVRQREDTPNPLPRMFFERPTLKVARELLGKVLIKQTPKGIIQAKIVDAEAYVGREDQACHASKGRTKRTEIMFGPAGFTYVYLIYGMYHCLNIVTEQEQYPAAVLIRGLEILGGDHSPEWPRRIDGPGRVCRFLEVNRTHNGLDATVGTTLWIEDHGLAVLPKQIQTLPRIGIDYAGEWANKLWRFCLPASTPPKSRRVTPK